MNLSKQFFLFILISFFKYNDPFRPEQEPEIIYLRHIERARPSTRPDDDDKHYPPPQFVVPLRDVQQLEGGKVHFEARIEPLGDPSMRVEWLLNGQLLGASKFSI